MTYKEIQKHVGSIRSIGHHHEEIAEWKGCAPCMVANDKANIQENIYKAKYPTEFKIHQLMMKSPKNKGYVHKL